MPVTEDEINAYTRFIGEASETFGCTEKPQDLIWHYTDGTGLIGIISSGSLHGTQIAALNDKNEAILATRLYRHAIEELLKETAEDP